jgi:hypothetical protein
MTPTHFPDALDQLIASIRLEAEKQFAQNQSINVPEGIIDPEESVPCALRDGIVLGIVNVLGGVPSAHVAFKIMEKVNTRADVLATQQPEVLPSAVRQVRSKRGLDLAA